MLHVCSDRLVALHYNSDRILAHQMLFVWWEAAGSTCRPIVPSNKAVFYRIAPSTQLCAHNSCPITGDVPQILPLH